MLLRLLPINQLEVILATVSVSRVPWRTYGIHANLNCVLDHIWNYLLQVLTGRAQVGVGVDLDEPDAEVLVHQKVKAKHFEAVRPLVGVHLVSLTQKAVNNDVFDSRHEVLLHVQLVFRKEIIQVILELLIRQTIALFELPILVTFIL